MGYHLTTNGQEQLAKNNFDGATVNVGLYDDSTDDPATDATLGDITSEPGGLTRPSSALSLTVSGVYVVLEGANTTLDVSSQSETVDSYFLERNGELILTGALEQQRDLSQIDELEVTTIGTEFTVPA